MDLQHNIFTLCLCLAIFCTVGSLSRASYTSGRGANSRESLSHKGHGGQHKGHGHVDLGKKDELEVQLLKLKDSTNEDSGLASLRGTSRGGQPEFTNEDLEEELTEVRPLDMPLHLLELETVEDQYHSNSMRTFGELDVGLTTVSSRLSELRHREEVESEYKSDIDLGEWDQDDEEDFRIEESDHSGDGSNLSPPTVTTTQVYNKMDVDKKGKEDEDGDEEDEDDADEDDQDDDDGDDDEESDTEDEDDDDGDDDEDDDESGDEDEADDEEDEDAAAEKKKVVKNKNRKLTVLKKSSDSATTKPERIESIFEDSIEHGRQWKQSMSSSENSEEGKETSTPDREEWSPLTTTTTTTSTTTGAPETSRDALERDLATFLRNESPETENHESMNVSDAHDDADTNEKKHSESDEAEFDSVHKLEQVRELEKKANIPQKLVDSVSPKADEDLLELMVRIAENPEEWQQVHRVLQQLDQDLVSSRKSLEQVKTLEKLSHRTEKKKDDEDPANAHSNKTELTKEHRKHQQGEKKKKKKKKQRQKEKLKMKAEKEAAKLNVKGKEEIRREELEKAGVLPPSNALFRSEEKEKASKVSMETSKAKSYWTKSSKDSGRTKIKGNSLHFIDAGKNNNGNQEDKTKSISKSKESERKYLSNSYLEKTGDGRMSSIDSAITYLSDSKQPNREISNNKLLTPTQTTKLDFNDNFPKEDDAVNEIEDSWPRPAEKWKIKNNKLFDTTRSHKGRDNPRKYQDRWVKPLSGSEISKIKEIDDNSLIGSPQFNEPMKIGGSSYAWKDSRTDFSNWPGMNKMNPKEERRYYSGEPVYNSPNSGWPRFSVESLKHGNLAGNIKNWPDVPIDQSLSSNKEDYANVDSSDDNWPNLSLNSALNKIKSTSIYSWPNYSDNNTKQNSIMSNKLNAWSKQPADSDQTKHREILANTWSQMPQQQQKPVSAIDTAIAHHSKEASSNKQWPHFAYHRVTSSPQILAQQQKEAQQRARHRSAYIAVSVIAPPGKNKALNKSQSRNNTSVAGSAQTLKNKSEESSVKPSVSPLPDKMDQLLSMRSEGDKFPARDLLEEQLVDMAVAGQHHQRFSEEGPIPWSHARHLDKIQEQLKTLSAMGEKLRYHWLEKERLMQILRDGGKSGSGFFRTQRDGSKVQDSKTTSSATFDTTTTNPPSPVTTPQTTHHPPTP